MLEKTMQNVIADKKQIILGIDIYITMPDRKELRKIYSKRRTHLIKYYEKHPNEKIESTG